MTWHLVVLLVAYPMFVIGAAALSVFLVLRLQLFRQMDEARWEREEARREHELRILKLKSEQAEQDAQKVREERTTRIEDTLMRMGWRPTDSTVHSSHPAGDVPPSPQQAETERFGRNMKRLEEMEEARG